MRIRSLIVLFVLCLVVPVGAWAQSCSVSISIAASATGSSSCFIPTNGVGAVVFTGSWVGTVRVQRSLDGGSSWKNEQTTTANTTYVLAPQNRNSLIRAYFDTRTSGTLTGSVVFNPPLTAKIAYRNVDIGNVAYGSVGNDGALGGTTKIETSDVTIPALAQPSPAVPGTGYFTATGCAVLIGGTTAAETVICQLYDVSGNLIANSATAGTSVGGSTNVFLSIPFVTPVNLAPGRYYMGIQGSGTSTTFRRITSSTFVDVVCGEITGQTYGTLQTVIAPPTTLTANKCPVGYLYH